MNAALTAQVRKLNEDYGTVRGTPAEHFFCPILFRDEPAALCRAHVINRSFSSSSRACTVQRADVDNFYGTHFESDFGDITKLRTISAEEILCNPALATRFEATVYHNDKHVSHFHSRAPVAASFTRVKVGGSDSELHLGLKMQPAEVESAIDGKWEIGIARDLRLPMLVSAIKSAHLTVFKLLGYRYGLSAAAAYFGRDILGEFFLERVRHFLILG